jgi:hypothetical protein
MGNGAIDRLWLSTLQEGNEVQRRHIAAVKAIEIGWGGIRKVCRLSGMSPNTVRKGIEEVRETQKKGHKQEPAKRLRKVGGGRKKITYKNPKIEQKIESILDENTAGDPMSKLKWTNKSTYTIDRELRSKGFDLSEDTVGRIIRSLGYTLQGNKKSKENGNTRERDSQFRYINQEVKRCDKNNIPVISVDAKKKELVGDFKNNGRTWLKKGKADVVNVYDYEYLSSGKAIPYGVYDVLKNNGFVNIGVSGNTAEFAVNSIERWWRSMGKVNYPDARELVICADCGGSNGSRNRLWKYRLWRFGLKSKLKITVLHYPPGTSKWNKIEHKMFSFISMNWRGKPLRTYEIILNLIKNTTTKTGLKISAKLDRETYMTGKKIDDEEFAKVKIVRRDNNPNWNYTLN